MMVIGIGNPLKSDDNIGNAVVEKLKVKDKIIAETAPENHTAGMRGQRTVVFVDAVDFGSKPGTVKLFTFDEILDFPSTTHAVSPSFFRKMLPRTSFYVVGIQPKSMEFSQKMSPEMDVDEIAKKVSELLDQIS